MQPEHLRFGGGAAGTAVNPLVLVVVLLACILICFLPRKYAIVPFFAVAILIPMDQVIVLGPLHFYMLRVLVVFGGVRLLWTKMSTKCKVFSGGVNGIDKALIFLSFISAVNSVLLWESSEALIQALGMIYTVFGVYFLLRFLVRDEEDVELAIRVFAYISAVVAMIMLYEQATGFNPYALLGGAREAAFQSLRERGDHFRAMGPFAHPILAGTFGAILLPLFVGLWARRRHRFAALLGMIASTVITVASVSSTPVLAYLGAIGALSLWPLRKQMRTVRWCFVLLLIGLQAVMKAPVWALIARMGVVGGSSGYHRYMLVDHFIRGFGDWWLMGIKNTGQWGWDMWDLANQYIAVGEGYGLVPFIFFLATIVFGFKYIGMARKVFTGRKGKEFFLWALGAALFSNLVAFFGISYFDQTQVVWYALLAVISAATIATRQATPVLAHTKMSFTHTIALFPTEDLSKRLKGTHSYRHQNSERSSF